MTEITRKCLALGKGDKERLIRILTDSLSEKENGAERFNTLHNIATDMFGKGILTNSREYNLVLARRMIVYTMRSEGYSYSSIGRYLTRHHASVMHMYKMMEDIFSFPNIYRLEMAYWEEFKRKIKDYDIHRTTIQNS